MMPSSIERKLTTIFSADVVGYARLMGQDEGGTLATLKTYREVMAGLIAGRRGRIVNTAGDSLLAEFPSVVQAVECAVQVQREVGERNGALPEDRRCGRWRGPQGGHWWRTYSACLLSSVDARASCDATSSE
jgi:adenylate cyclase